MLLYFFPLRITLGAIGTEYQSVADAVAIIVDEIYRYLMIYKHLDV